MVLAIGKYLFGLIGGVIAGTYVEQPEWLLTKNFSEVNEFVDERRGRKHSENKN
jgi:hypothetical protein